MNDVQGIPRPPNAIEGLRSSPSPGLRMKRRTPSTTGRRSWILDIGVHDDRTRNHRSPASADSKKARWLALLLRPTRRVNPSRSRIGTLRGGLPCRSKNRWWPACAPCWSVSSSPVPRAAAAASLFFGGPAPPGFVRPEGLLCDLSQAGSRALACWLSRRLSADATGQKTSSSLSAWIRIPFAAMQPYVDPGLGDR
jgi:hypothetical protein